MAALTHTQARRCVQAAADGRLSFTDQAALDAHLAGCAECRAYAAELLTLEAAVTRGLRMRWEADVPLADLSLKVRMRLRRDAVRRPLFMLAAAAGLAVLILFAVWLGSTFLNRNVEPLSTAPFPTAVLAPTPVGGGRITFDSERDGNREIYVMNGDGSAPKNLTNYSANEFGAIADFGPAWSPDGQRLAFFSERTGWLEIFVMQSDGSNVVQLTDVSQLAERGQAWWLSERGDVGWSSLLAWSPDGAGLAVVRALTDVPPRSALTGSQLYLINTDGSGAAGKYIWTGSQIYLINVEEGAAPPGLPLPASNPDYRTFSLNPRWSPDGTHLAFIDVRDSGSDLFVIGPDGTGLVNLSHDAASVKQTFAWSPDGTQLAYFSSRQADGAHQAELKLVKADGSGQKTILALESKLSFYTSLAWSPEGARLLFAAANEDGKHQSLYLVYEDGSGLMRLTEASVWNSRRSWSPDGKWIAFVSDQDGDHEIYAINVADAFRNPKSLRPIRLTHSPGADANPQWQP